MEAKAYLRNARISPRKVQIVLDLIRNKTGWSVVTWQLWTSHQKQQAHCWKNF